MVDQCLVSYGALLFIIYYLASPTAGFHAAGARPTEAELQAVAQFRLIITSSWEELLADLGSQLKEGKGSCRGAKGACRALPELLKACRPGLWWGRAWF